MVGCFTDVLASSACALLLVHVSEAARAESALVARGLLRRIACQPACKHLLGVSSGTLPARAEPPCDGGRAGRQRLAMLGAACLLLAHSARARAPAASYAGMLLERARARTGPGAARSTAALAARLLLALLAVYAGYVQARRIALRDWALFSAHRPAGAWRGDAHDNNWLLLEALLAVPLAAGLRTGAAARLLAAALLLEAVSCWPAWATFPTWRVPPFEAVSGRFRPWGVCPAPIWVRNICCKLPAVTGSLLGGLIWPDTAAPGCLMTAGARQRAPSQLPVAQRFTVHAGTAFTHSACDARCMRRHSCDVRNSALERAGRADARAPPPAGTTRRTCARISAPTWALQAACCCCSRWARAASQWTACCRRPRARERGWASGATGLLLRPVARAAPRRTACCRRPRAGERGGWLVPL